MQPFIKLLLTVACINAFVFFVKYTLVTIEYAGHVFMPGVVLIKFAPDTLL
jgi:hypothetical protein